MHRLFFLIGSCGSGKTTAANAIEAMKVPGLTVLYSDSLPVPSTEEMIKECGSQEEWQRANTARWVAKIKNEYLDTTDVLFDTQSRPSFIDESCQQHGVTSYEAVLLDCADEERRRRLVGRNQPELATDQMMNWARYLRERCVGKNYTIVDNTHYAPAQSLVRLLTLIGK